MKLQQATRYAIWAVIELASRPDEQISAQELAETYRTSKNHLVRILHALTKARIVTSARGPGGGFTFCGNAKRLTLYDIICLFETGWPNEEGDDAGPVNPLAGELSRVLHEVDRITSATLRSVTVQTIINNARRSPGAVSDRFESHHAPVTAGLVPATSKVEHGASVKRGGRDKPGHDRSG